MEQDSPFLYIPNSLSSSGGNYNVFFYVNTLWVVIVEFVLMASYCAICFVDLPFDKKLPLDLTPFKLRTIIQVLLYLFIVIFNRYLNYVHKQARSRGYLEFYRKTRILEKSPFYIWSVGNAAIIILLSIWLADLSNEKFNTINALQIIVCLEFVCTSIFLVLYAHLIIIHNKRKYAPDAYSDLEGMNNRNRMLNIQEDEEDISSKQEEIIRYLREQKEKLSKQILELNSKIKQYEQNFGSPRKNDEFKLLEAEAEEYKKENEQLRRQLHQLEKNKK